MTYILIFKSDNTGAVYSWNGKEVVTIVGAKNRPVGQIMNGFSNQFLKNVFDKNYMTKDYRYFNIGDAGYEIISRIGI